MKIFNTVVKVVVTLAAVAGVVYVVATYGEKIVAWCKKMLGSCNCCCNGECCCTEEDVAEEVPEAEEAPVVEEAPADDAEPVADEADFEG